MSSAQKDTGYILGYSEEEHARLEKQAAGLEPGTLNALNKIGVAAGWRCLDVACGTASVTRILGGLVGQEALYTLLIWTRLMDNQPLIA